jgi:Flp pilus assembly protein TadD
MMNVPLYRVLVGAGLLALLTACAPPRTAVRPVDTVIDRAALQAGDLRIAASALQSGDVCVARSLYTTLAKSHPGMPEVWLGLGDTHFLAGEFESAQSAYARAEELDPDGLAPKLAQARVLIRLRKLDEARTRFQAILGKDPDQPVALAGLGVVYDLSGQPALAQETYRKGLAKHPGDQALRANLGLSLALSGKGREAVNVLLGNSGVQNGLPQIRDNLALAYGVMGREDAAEGILMSYQPRGVVQDNLAFYQYLREHLGTASAPASAKAVPVASSSPPARSGGPAKR